MSTTQARFAHSFGPEIAHSMSNTSLEEQLSLFSELEPKLAAETFDYLPNKSKEYLLQNLQPSLMAKVLLAIRPDDRTAILQELPKQKVDEFLSYFSEKEKRETLTLLGYPEDIVGHYMTTDFIVVKMPWSMAKVLEHIRAYGHDSETINIIYVTDDEGRLIDDFRLRNLFFVPLSHTVSEICDGTFIALKVTDKAEEAINVFREYDRTALPVVDDKNRLIGIVTIDDILRLESEESTEDMQKIAAIQAFDEPYMEISFFNLMKKRAGWLVILFIGEMLTATAMGFFEAEIASAIVLALFLPLIISSGGNAGSQSTTLIIRAMALGEVQIADWRKVMRREIFSGLVLGTILGCIGFLRVGIWDAATNVYGEHWFSIAATIFFSLMGVVMWGSFTGSMLPILLKKIGVDPATASAPLVATLVDVTGITMYFGIAMYTLKGTLL